MQCWICTRQARGFGHMDVRYHNGDSRRYPLDWVFCSRRCQDVFHTLYSRWIDAKRFGMEAAMIDPTELELSSMRQCLQAFGEVGSVIGFDKPLGAYSEEQALAVIDAIVTCYTEAMAIHHEAAQFLPVRLNETANESFADLENDFSWGTTR